ncbi:response regulator [Magnetospirillum molischianum]|uniref:Putative two-component response transcriptional regulator, HD domain n=1 Tax=Magnetospirillum molischianum DSM 120 TaxID=1150626 RepID=H8FN75_MAGML|nr:HD domain-containing phosphohydrolase [Magnetospirillum molischianum]CCG39813.1 Putative two-component response transcriptional regulator, HD domain [Magnetospirillum molischianum DSM 120]
MHVPLISVIDGNAANRAKVADVLMSMYRVNQYPDAERGWHGLRVAPPRVVLIDDEIPPHGGFALVNQMRLEPVLANVAVVIVTRHDKEEIAQTLEQCGAKACLSKPYGRNHLIQTISSLINQEVEAQWNDLEEPSRLALRGTVKIFNDISESIAAGEPVPFISVKDACAPLVDAIGTNDVRDILDGVKEHDNYSYAHSLRVATLLSLFGHTLGLPREDLMMLASGGLLHDVGKVAIPHEVLNKPGRLTDPEFEVMKGHVTETLRYLDAGNAIPKPVRIVAAQHHEKLDGTGYPHGLHKGELNELARMASIADVFSALTDRRVYKPAMEAEKALTLMTEQMIHHLDQHLVRLFRTMLLDAVHT